MLCSTGACGTRQPMENLMQIDLTYLFNLAHANPYATILGAVAVTWALANITARWL